MHVPKRGNCELNSGKAVEIVKSEMDQGNFTGRINTSYWALANREGKERDS